MTTELSFGNAGLSYTPFFTKHQMMSSLLMSRKRQPLPHSIDAILHKTKATPLNSTSSMKPTLPHIETLRRSNPHGFVLQLPTSKVSIHDTISFKCVTDTVIDGVDEIRTCASLHSSMESSCSEDDEEEEEVVVDDENTEDSLVPLTNQSTKETTHGKEHVHLQEKCSNTSLVSHQQPNSDSPTCGKVNNNLNVAAEKCDQNAEEEVVKSAFKPIVRPWLVGRETLSAFDGCCGGDETFHRVACTTLGLSSKGVAKLGSRNRPVHAISTLMKHSSAFGVHPGGATYRPEVSRHRHLVPTHNAVSSATSASLPGEQPLPSTLASWFSWLRAGGMQFGSDHPFPYPHSGPFHGPTRDVLPPPVARPLAAAQPHSAPRYNCEACGKSYSTFGGLSKHKQFHCSAQVKKDFRCKYCEKSYTSLGALKMHIRTHTLPCKCTVCGKAFSRPWLLQGHVRTHTGEKPFSCQHCSRAFADRSNLRAHLQTHSHVKKYSCQHCHKSFSRMSLLTKHRDSSCPSIQR